MSARPSWLTEAHAGHDAAAAIDHDVGDRTMIVRPVRPRFGTWLPIAITAVGVAAVIVVFALRDHTSTVPASPPPPRGEIRLPPPSATPILEEAVVAAPVEDAQATRTDIGAPVHEATPETANEAPREPGTLVKLRDNDPPAGSGTETKKVRRKRVTRPPTDEAAVDATWDPKALFPQQ